MCHRTIVCVVTLFAAVWCSLAHPQTSDPTEPDVRELESALSLTRIQRVTVQRGLAALGFEVGPLDGIFGRRTRAAISEWQASTGNPVSGYVDTEGARTLLAAGWRASPRKDSADTLKVLKYWARIAATESLDDRRRGTALLALLLEQAAAGDIQDALATAQLITRAHLRSYALASVAQHQANAGDFRGAMQTHSEALASARTIADDTSRELALSRTDEALAAIDERRKRRPGSLPAVPAAGG